MEPVRNAVILAAALLAAGCQGSVPPLKGDANIGYGAVIVRGQVTTPTGETTRARLSLNLESESHRFIVPFVAGETTLYVVPPGTYRLMPQRAAFGVVDKGLTLSIENRMFRVPFPRDILRLDSFEVRPHKVVPLGILRISARRDPGDRKVDVQVSLDTSKDARRQLVQDKIAHMLDSHVSPYIRDAAIAWTHALDEALVRVESDPGIRPAYKTRD